MQDTVIEAGAEIEYVVSDKYVTVSEGKQLKGTDSFPGIYCEGSGGIKKMIE